MSFRICAAWALHSIKCLISVCDIYYPMFVVAISNVHISNKTWRWSSWALYQALPWNWSHKTSWIVSQYLFRQWLDAVRQQTITWTNNDYDLGRHMSSLTNNDFMKMQASLCCCHTRLRRSLENTIHVNYQSGYFDNVGNDKPLKDFLIEQFPLKWVRTRN